MNIGLDFYNENNIIASLLIGKVVTGSESITSRPYDRYSDYLKGKFPSGIQKKTAYVEVEYEHVLKPFSILFGSLHINGFLKKKPKASVIVGVKYSFKDIFKLN